MEDRSKRAETARPLHDEHCEGQLVCDSSLSATCDMNGIELNVETDDENMENGETRFDDGSAAARDIRDPGQRTESTSTHIDLTDHGASSV